MHTPVTGAYEGALKWEGMRIFPSRAVALNGMSGLNDLSVPVVDQATAFWYASATSEDIRPRSETV
jgi:hypothetical protein